MTSPALPSASQTVSRLRPEVRERRRERILRAATDVLYEQGLRQATMEDIAKRLKTSKIALYRYFPTKDQLIAEILQRVMERFVAAEHLPWPNLKAVLRRTLGLAREDTAAYLLMARSAAHDPVLSRYWEELRALVYETTRRRMLLLENPVCADPVLFEVVVRGMVDFLFEALAYWVENGKPENDEAWLSWCANAAVNIVGWNREQQFDTLPSVLSEADA